MGEFAKATRAFKKSVDPTGDLISVDNVRDGLKLKPLTVVIKKEEIFSIKYQIMDYTILELLDEKMHPSDVKTEDFMKSFRSTSGTGVGVDVTADIPAVSVGTSAKGKMTNNLWLTAPKLDSVNVPKLIKGYSDRKVTDANRKLLPKLKKGESLAFVKERVYTSTDFELSGSTEMEAALAAKFQQIFGISIKGDYRGDTSKTIREGTVLLYSLRGLKIEEQTHDMEFENRSLIETIEIKRPSLIETMGPVRHQAISVEDRKRNHRGYMLMEMAGVSSPVTGKVKLNIENETSNNTSQNSFKTLHQVQEELQDKEAVLQLLAELQQSSRSALIQRLCELLDHREDLTDLEDTLEKWCDGDTFNWPKAQSACEILKLLRMSSSDPTSVLKAAHLLVSMMDALPGPIPSALARCSPDILGGLDTLVNNLKVNSQSPPPDSLPGSLQDGGEFSWAAEILCSTSETLEELKDLWVETGVEPGVFLLALCITVQGLSLLQA